MNNRLWQVSSTGGTRPLRSRDDRELFFLDGARRMTSVRGQPAPVFAFSPPQTLFDTAPLGLEGQHRNFDLSPDGKRFLTVRSFPPTAEIPTVVLIQHRFEELRARVR